MIELSNSNKNPNKDQNLVSQEEQKEEPVKILPKVNTQSNNTFICIMYIILVLSFFSLFIFNFRMTYNSINYHQEKSYTLEPDTLCNQYHLNLTECLNKTNNITECGTHTVYIEKCYDTVLTINADCYVYLNELKQCYTEDKNAKCYWARRDLKDCVRGYKLVKITDIVSIIKKSVI